jgi:hypothetical protein
MESIVQSFDSNINSILQDYVKKPTLIRGVVHLLLMLYVVRLAPQPPKPVLQLFENVYFKLFIFSLVLWTAQFSPSTSLLIALAFLVTMNYVNTGKVWEYLENVKADTVMVPAAVTTGPASPATAVEAVKVLAEAAASPVPASLEVVKPVAEIAASAATTQEGVDAIKALANQAIAPSAAPVEQVAEVAQAAVQSIVPTEPVVVVAPAPVEPVTPKQAVEAVKALAQAASSPSAIPAEDVIPVAKIAIEAAASAGDAKGVAAVKALAEQAMEPAAGKPEQVAAAKAAAIEAVVSAPVPAPVAAAEQAVGAPTPAAQAAQASGCYPLRKYDMGLVKPQSSGRFTYEDYGAFTSTPQ